MSGWNLPRRNLLVHTCWAVFATVIIVSSTFGQSRYTARRQIESLGLIPAWQAQLSSGIAESGANVRLHVNTTKTTKIYDVIENGQRISFSGPTAEHDSDIRLRTLLLSDREATLEVREIPKISVYSHSSTGRLESFDAETGQRHWSIRIGSPGAPAYVPAVNDDTVVAISGANLLVISADTGKLIFDRPLIGVAEDGPTLIGDSILVPEQSGSMKVYSLDAAKRNLSPAEMMSFGRVTSRPKISSAGVTWTTGRGLFVGDSDSLDSKFRIRPRGDVIGNPAYGDGNRLAMTLAEGYVLAIDAATGATIWEFGAGEPLASPTYAAHGAFFVGSVDGNLFAIEAETGSQRWVASSVAQILCHDEHSIYGSVSNELVAIDPATGTVRGRVTLGPSDQILPNHQTDRIFIVSASGRLRCLRRASAEWPTVHAGIPKPTPSVEEEETPAGTTTEAPTETTEESASDDDGWGEASDEDPFAEGAGEDEDPFGEGGDEDPFGESGDEDPFGDSGDEDEDPFG